MQTIALRPITDDDQPFLRALYGNTREAELALTDWNEAQKATFVAMQFEAQHHHYHEHYVGASFDVILLNGEPIGRLYVARWPQEIRIVDIALLPEQRGRGFGTTLLQSLLDEAQQRNVLISIHVEQFNPALHLYERLGFQRVSEFGVYWLLSREPT